MYLDDAISDFLLQLDADGRSEHTRRQYARHLAELQRWLAQGGHTLALSAIETIDHRLIAAFFGAPETKTGATEGKRKATSLNALRTSIRCFFSYLHEAGLISKNPARMLRRAIAPPPAPRALSDPEVERFLAALEEADSRDRMIFRLMLQTGIRLSTAIALNVEDLDLDAGVMAVWMKGDRRERMEIETDITEELRNYVGERRLGPVFCGRGGQRLGARQVQRRFSELATRAGIGGSASPHALRHTFATRLYEASQDILTVKRALRHRSVASTLIYAEQAGYHGAVTAAR